MPHPYDTVDRHREDIILVIVDKDPDNRVVVTAVAYDAHRRPAIVPADDFDNHFLVIKDPDDRDVVVIEEALDDRVFVAPGVGARGGVTVVTDQDLFDDCVVISRFDTPRTPA